MKHLFLAIALASVAGFAGNVSAKNNSGSSSSEVSMPASHHSSAAPTIATSRFNGIPHYPGSMPYRPVVTYQNGIRTLNYPSVGISTMRRTPNFTANTFHRASHSNGSSMPIQNRLDPQTSSRLRNWSGKIDSPTQARLNNSEQIHHHHDCNWWRHHCVAIVFLDWGWWGWYDGWWYPAWGYDPYFAAYPYDEPIYGGSGLSPDQIVANVQSALQQQGYYRYAADGRMGPLTRSAIGNFQRDHRLPITYRIDPATLGALGLIGR